MIFFYYYYYYLVGLGNFKFLTGKSQGISKSCGCEYIYSLMYISFSLQLMKSFSVMPMDQHLSLNGDALTDDAATLISLGIRPGSLLLLKVCFWVYVSGFCCS